MKKKNTNATITPEQFKAIKAERMKKELLGQLENAKGAEKARIEKALFYLENVNDSTFGRITELFACTKKSGKTRVSAQNKADTFIKWTNQAGKVVNRPAEVKTNGGRIGSLIKQLEKGKDTLFIYSLDICNANTGYQQRKVEPIICMFSAFYAMLDDCKAMKQTNGAFNEIAIQSTSKKMYNRLVDWCIPYEKDMVYCENDFDELEF